MGDRPQQARHFHFGGAGLPSASDTVDEQAEPLQPTYSARLTPLLTFRLEQEDSNRQTRGMESWQGLVEARLTVKGASAESKGQADSLLPERGIRRSLTSDIEARLSSSFQSLYR